MDSTETQFSFSKKKQMSNTLRDRLMSTVTASVAGRDSSTSVGLPVCYLLRRFDTDLRLLANSLQHHTVPLRQLDQLINLRLLRIRIKCKLHPDLDEPHRRSPLPHSSAKTTLWY